MNLSLPGLLSGHVFLIFANEIPQTESWDVDPVSAGGVLTSGRGGNAQQRGRKRELSPGTEANGLYNSTAMDHIPKIHMLKLVADVAVFKRY